MTSICSKTTKSKYKDNGKDKGKVHP
jgi:hypothetical protein